jgi:ribosomal protein S18 acetylase RimI-like enzyme
VAPPPASFRNAEAGDADGVAALHADSWRRHYRGAYSDAYLDGDVLSDRRAVWSARLAAPGPESVTIVADAGAGMAGFVHVILDEDEVWGSLVDNLHVAFGRQRHGMGSALMARAARAVVERGRMPAMYLWVLEQNTAAQAFYTAIGGRSAERRPVNSPGDVPGRLNGQPWCLRYVWPDAGAVPGASGQRP